MQPGYVGYISQLRKVILLNLALLLSKNIDLREPIPRSQDRVQEIFCENPRENEDECSVFENMSSADEMSEVNLRKFQSFTPIPMAVRNSRTFDYFRVT